MEISADFIRIFDANTKSWMDQGLCKGYTNVFFPARGQNQKVSLAKKICERCPVKQQCLDFALDNQEMHGVWGGTSERTRRVMRRNIRNGIKVVAIDQRTKGA